MNKRRRYLLAALGLAGVFLTVFLTSEQGRALLAPRYEARAVVEMRIGSPFPLQGEIDYLNSGEFREILLDNLGLAKRWGMDREKALRKLDGIVSATKKKGTDLVVLSARHSDQKEALEMDREAAAIFKKRNEERLEREDEKRIEILKSSYDAQMMKVAGLKEALMPGNLTATPESSDTARVKWALAREERALEEMKIEMMSMMLDIRDYGPGLIIHDEPSIDHSTWWSNLSGRMNDWFRYCFP